MSHRITRWSPDTCECVIDYVWDDAVPVEDRTHTHHGTVHACVAHAKHQHDAVFTYALVENQRKNQSIATIMKHAPHVQHEHTSWRFDADRILHLSVHLPLAPEASAAIQQSLHSTHGDGAVILHEV